jgi:hypothetical protein
LATDADVYGDTRHFRDPLEQAADTIEGLAEFIAESLLTTDQYMEKYGLTSLHEAVEHEKRRMRELGIEVG